MLLGRGMESEHQNKTAMKEKKTNKNKNKMMSITVVLDRTLALSQRQPLHGPEKRLYSMSFKEFFLSDSPSP